MNKYWCDNCQQDRSGVEKIRTETYRVRGEAIDIKGKFMVCASCGEIVCYNEFDERNLIAAYNEYRKRNGLLKPEVIVNIRKKFKLSQRGLGTLLGWSPATIARYESGAIPSVANHEQLKRFATDFDYAYELYNKSKHGLNDLEAKRVHKLFESLKSGEAESEDSVDWLTRFYSSKVEELRGNQEFDIDRVANIVAFLSHRGKVVKFKLMKLLFYADFVAYRDHGKSITGIVYYHNHYGPIPQYHGMLLDCLNNLKSIKLEDYEGPYDGEYVVPLLSFKKDVFEEEELDVLQEVWERLGGYSAKELSSISHDEEAYQRTALFQESPYNFAYEIKIL